MSTHHLLPLIADLYTPALVLIVFYQIYRQATTRRLRSQQLVVGLVLVYGMMMVDSYFQLWLSLGLDYSTHTAIALVLVLFINHPRQHDVLTFGSLIAYAGLMIYLHYHSLVDILSTAIVIAPPYRYALAWMANKPR